MILLINKEKKKKKKDIYLMYAQGLQEKFCKAEQDCFVQEGSRESLKGHIALAIDVLFRFFHFLRVFSTIFSNGGHLGYRTVLTDTILKGDHPRIISAKFG
jgi:hypothetical protein